MHYSGVNIGSYSAELPGIHFGGLATTRQSGLGHLRGSDSLRAYPRNPGRGVRGSEYFGGFWLTNALDLRGASVDEQLDSVHEARVIGSKEGRRSGDLFRPAHRAARNRSRQRLPAFIAEGL